MKKTGMIYLLSAVLLFGSKAAAQEPPQTTPPEAQQQTVTPEMQKEQEEVDSRSEKETEESKTEPVTEPVTDPITEPVTETARKHEGAFFEIDNQRVYEGMDKSFQKGYVPQVKKKRAVLVVPFLEQAAVEGGKVQAEINLGDSEKAPFVFKNYNSTLTKKSYSKNSDSWEAYLLNLKLELKKDAEAGSYPVIITLKGTGINGEVIGESYTLYVTVEGTPEPDANQPAEPEPDGAAGYDGGGSPAADSGEEKPKPKPKVILQGLSISTGALEAGQEAELKATFLNTNDSSYIQNIVVDVAAAENSLLFEKQSFYVKQVGAGKEFDISINAEVMKNTMVHTDKLVFSLRYEDSSVNEITEEESATVRIEQPVVVKLDNLTLASSLEATETVPVSMEVINLSRVKIYNVRFSLEGQGLLVKESAFIGNMEAGSSQAGTLQVFVGTMDMEERDGEIVTEGDEKYGPVTGKMTVYYEDEFGKEYNEELEFDTTIKKAETLTPVIPKERIKKESQWWISIAAVVAGALLAMGGGLIRKKIQRRAEMYGREQTGKQNH